MRFQRGWTRVTLLRRLGSGTPRPCPDTSHHVPGRALLIGCAPQQPTQAAVARINFMASSGTGAYGRRTAERGAAVDRCMLQWCFWLDPASARPTTRDSCQRPSRGALTLRALGDSHKASEDVRVQ